MRVIYGDEIGKEIPDEQVKFYDGCVYIIYADKCKNIILDAEFDDPISLADISKKRWNVEKVIFEQAFCGWIYNYGNHRPGEWELVGETCGYA